MNQLDDAIKSSGGPAKVADAIGVSVQRLCNWTDRGVPVEMCAAVERATAGSVRRWDLRPDDWWAIWPELVGAKGAPRVPAGVN